MAAADSKLTFNLSRQQYYTVSSNIRIIKQTKSLGDYLRAKFMKIPALCWTKWNKY